MCRNSPCLVSAVSSILILYLWHRRKTQPRKGNRKTPQMKTRKLHILLVWGGKFLFQTVEKKSFTRFDLMKLRRCQMFVLIFPRASQTSFAVKRKTKIEWKHLECDIASKFFSLFFHFSLSLSFVLTTVYCYESNFIRNTLFVFSCFYFRAMNFIVSCRIACTHGLQCTSVRRR